VAPPDDVDRLHDMKILFFVHHLGSFRMYESVVRSLAARGHDIQLLIGRSDNLGWARALDELVAAYPAVRHQPFEPPSDTVWFEAGKTIRLWADYLRYLEPAYAETPKLRRRAGELLPPALRAIADSAFLSHAAVRGTFLRALRGIERSLPRLQEVDDFLAAEKPDLVLITPLIYLASVQMQVLRSAVALGLRTGFCVGSWDHLSSKALLRDLPLRVFVWNETQRREAVELHKVPTERVVVTGAQCYDQWFGRQPSRSREAFCAAVGLPADRPFLLYVGSALFRGSPVEANFVEEWVRRIRSSEDSVVRDAPILLRPHPARMEEWRSVDFSPYRDVVLYGSNPVDEPSKHDYFDSLYYSAAVVGLNTSAFIEAAVVGRHAHTLLLPEFWENQEGTLHFHYLLTVGGGVLQAARSHDEHHAQLAASLTAPYQQVGTGFVEAFVRPYGLATPATDVFVQAVEELARHPGPAPVPTSVAVPLFRELFLRPLLWFVHTVFGPLLMRVDWTERARKRERVLKEKQEARLRAEELKRQKLAAHQRLLEERARAAAAARAARAAAWRKKAEERAAQKRARQALELEQDRLKQQRVEERQRQKALARERLEHDKDRQRRRKRRAKRYAQFKDRAGRLVKRVFAQPSGSA
jgi:hypothetical protein